MTSSFRKLALAVACSGLIALQGCGGGDSASSSVPATATTVSGVAASGAAFEGATIIVKDSTGATVGTSAAVGADGQYTVTLNAGATAPFVLIATRTSTDGASESLVSVVPALSGTSATANITPVTHLIASRLSTSGDPLKLADEVASSAATVSTATVAASVTEVQGILAPVLTAASITGTNPLTDAFSTDGTGYDRLLDSIMVTIIPAGATTANIEVAVKQADAAAGSEPVAIQFTSDTATASLPALPVIAPTSLIAEGTATKIAALLTQLNSCFALPVDQRVDTPDPVSPTLATPNQSNIVARACRAAFIQDTAGVISYEHNGAVISAVTDRPFFGLFRSTATGLTYSQGAYEFTRANGDIVISYKRTTSGGAEVFDTFVVRNDAADGDKLKLIGNQYQFPGSVAAYHQLRRFVTLNQSAWDYYSTGYNLNVPNVTSGGGASLFDRVEVTTPRGVLLTLKPTTGSSYLGLVKAGGVNSGTSFVRLNSEFVATANTTDPALKDTTMFFADRTVFTNEVIAAIPMQAVWKFDYYLASAPTTLAATQYYKTRARALTLPELKTKGLAVLSAADIATIQAGANPTGGPRPGQFPIGNAASLPVAYSVPAGALPPTQLMVWGTYTGGSFNDAASVLSTARSGTIFCSKATAGDNHCQTTVVGATAPYDLTAALSGAHLRAIEPTGREYASFYAMYPLAP